MKSSSVNAADSPPKRILIVDGQEMIRSLLCRILKSWGLDCHPATDLLSACRAVISEGPFDAVVCDYEMPDGNVCAMVALMRGHEAVTPAAASAGSVDATAKSEAGVELLAKPFDPIELKGALERTLGVSLRTAPEPAKRKERAAARV